MTKLITVVLATLIIGSPWVAAAEIPVVPGVLQLDWAMDLVVQLLGQAPRVTEIESLKLTSPLRPGQRFRIQSRVTADSKVVIKLWSRDAIHATGRVRLEVL